MKVESYHHKLHGLKLRCTLGVNMRVACVFISVLYAFILIFLKTAYMKLESCYYKLLDQKLKSTLGVNMRVTCVFISV